MISEKEAYTRLISHTLKENWKSFSILFELKHYGNCISIMCQELDQVIRLLYLIKSRSHEKDELIAQAINSQKWFLLGPDRKKTYITEETLSEFAKTLTGWEKAIYEFGLAFKSLSSNYNYILKDPIKGMKDAERDKIHAYIVEYHDKDFPADFALGNLIPELQAIFERISENLKLAMEQL